MNRLQRHRPERILRQLFRPTNQAFTLIELIVVILIMGIITAIALPTLIRHVGKAREAEAKHGLSAVGFAQQGYFFEYRQFAPTYTDLGISIGGTFFDFPNPDSSPGTYRTKSQAISKEANALGSARNYAYGTYYLLDSYTVMLCQSPDAATITQVPDDSSGDCTGGVQIR